MEKAKVYFTDFRTKAFGDGLPTKLKKMIKKAGIGHIDMKGRFVAIKLHFGELGNISYLRPNYARAVVDTVKDFGGKPFLTDCNTMARATRLKPGSFLHSLRSVRRSPSAPRKCQMAHLLWIKSVSANYPDNDCTVKAGCWLKMSRHNRGNDVKWLWCRFPSCLLQVVIRRGLWRCLP